MGLAEVAEVPCDAVEREADVEPVSGGHGAEAGRELGEVGGEAAVAAVGVAGEAVGEDCVDFLEDGFVVLLEDGVLGVVGGVFHEGEYSRGLVDGFPHISISRCGENRSGGEVSDGHLQILPTSPILQEA